MYVYYTIVIIGIAFRLAIIYLCDTLQKGDGYFNCAKVYLSCS